MNRIYIICPGVQDMKKVFRGGYSGYFQDPDGYCRKVACVYSWEFDENDILIIKE